MLRLLLSFCADRVFVIGWIWPRFPTVGQGLDLGRDVGGVVFHPAEQRRAAGVLPVQAEKVETPAITSRRGM